MLERLIIVTAGIAALVGVRVDDDQGRRRR